MASSINASTAGSGGVITTADSSGILNIQTAGTNAITVNASQNVGIGTTPSAWGNIFKTLQIGSGIGTGFLGGRTDSINNVQLGVNAYYDTTDSRWEYVASSTATRYYQSEGTHVWDTAASGTANNAITWVERMTINANGNLLIGTTTEAANETALVLSKNSGTTRWSVGPFASVPTNFYITATSAAQGVYLSGTSATSWSGLSDERYKKDLKPIENAIDKVSSLRAVTGKYKSDEEQKSRSFLIAQDVLEVLPEAVDNSDPDKLGLAYTDVIPLLVAAIKELTERVKILEGAK